MQKPLSGTLRSSVCKGHQDDQAFSEPKGVGLARMSEKSYELLCKMFAAAPERTRDELEPILGKKFIGYANGKDRSRNDQQQRITW